VTQPTPDMLKTALSARTGDDVFGEDPTVAELQEHAAALFQKEAALFVPTGTMANLVAVLAHRQLQMRQQGMGSDEVMVGAASHVSLWEGGGVSTVGGIHSRQLVEDPVTARLDPAQIRGAYSDDSDDHCAASFLLCLENTHNMLGGVALPASYVSHMGSLARELGMALHVDGARIFNAAAALHIPVAELCASADSVAVCMSKGLGAPLGSVLVGSAELIRVAKRHRKRLGGGMRQAGVVAAMGLYSLRNNVHRIDEDHVRAQRFGAALHSHGFQLLRDGLVDTNIVYFALPEHATVPSREAFAEELLRDFGVSIGGGYGTDKRLFRAVTHLNVSDDDVERAIDGICSVALRKR
jgi:threonine aldolase